MNPLVHAMTKFDNVLEKLEEGALIALVVAMGVTLLLQVIFRYFLKNPIFWSEELARYLFIWVCLLGTSVTVQRRGHYGLELFYKMIPGNGRRLVGLFIYLVMGVVILMLLTQGIILVKNTASQISPAMEISMGWPYAALPFGAALMAIHLLVIGIKEIGGKAETR